jgi:hypothetical protein
MRERACWRAAVVALFVLRPFLTNLFPVLALVVRDGAAQHLVLLQMGGCGVFFCLACERAMVCLFDDASRSARVRRAAGAASLVFPLPPSLPSFRRPKPAPRDRAKGARDQRRARRAVIAPCPRASDCGSWPLVSAGMRVERERTAGVEREETRRATAALLSLNGARALSNPPHFLGPSALGRLARGSSGRPDDGVEAAGGEREVEVVSVGLGIWRGDDDLSAPPASYVSTTRWFLTRRPGAGA